MAGQKISPKRPWLDVLLGILLPPIEVLRMKGVGVELLIDFVLWITLIGSVFYCFHLKGIKPLVNLFCILLPPLGVLLGEGNKITIHFWVCLILTFFFWLPGIFFAYLVV